MSPISLFVWLTFCLGIVFLTRVVSPCGEVSVFLSFCLTDGLASRSILHQRASCRLHLMACYAASSRLSSMPGALHVFVLFIPAHNSEECQGLLQRNKVIFICFI